MLDHVPTDRRVEQSLPPRAVPAADHDDVCVVPLRVLADHGPGVTLVDLRLCAIRQPGGRLVGGALGGGMCGVAMEAMARQPEMQGKLQGAAIVLIAFIEAIALFAVVVSFLAMDK